MCVLKFPAILACMPRQKAFIVIGLCLLLLTACSSAAHTPASAPTAVAVAASPYDGVWNGNGASPQGRAVSVKFSVSGGAITSFTYTYTGLDGTSCTGIGHEQIPPAVQPKIVDAAFSNVFGDDLTASGKFSSPDEASGHIFA